MPLQCHAGCAPWTGLLLVLCAPRYVEASTRVPVVVHVAQDGGEPVAQRSWINAVLQKGSELYVKGAMSFELNALGRWPLPTPDIMTVAERNALAAQVKPQGAIHVFVVRRLADKDRSGHFINGVHWRHRGRRYIILSRKDAAIDTLAHEMGHFFGLGHDRRPGNLMCSPGRDEVSSLSPSQLDRVRQAVRRAVRQQRLVPR